MPLGAVTDRTARGGEAGGAPAGAATRAVAPWSAVTPPRGPWEPAGLLPGDLLAAVARAGLAEVADAVRERGAAAGLVRDRVWARDVLEASGPHPDPPDPEGGGFQGARACAPVEPSAPMPWASSRRGSRCRCCARTGGRG